LRLFPSDTDLIVHAELEIRHTALGIPMGGSSEQVWYRFARKAE
jgi:hypothetical protein